MVLDEDWREEMTKQLMQEAAREVVNKIPDYGYILLVTPFGNGEVETEAHYISNCNREDAIKILKSMLFRWGINEQWMQDAK